jgi:excisionase family DNA binding protein
MSATTDLPVARLVKAREAAAMLGCSRPHVYVLIKAGVLRPVRLHPTGDLRFRVTDIERLIAGGSQ